MFRIDDATAANSLPAPEAAGAEGYFTEGNPATGTPATNVRGSWLNMIQEELCAILAAAGIVRAKTTYNQVNAALQKMYSPVVGTVRNMVMNVSTASASATLTADQIVVATALNGQTFILSSVNKTINLAGTNGAGAMDTGSAPASGYVAVYLIYNPTTQTAALLGVNATSTVVSEIYSGSNMPSGYTASALVSVRATNGSSQFVPSSQRDRKVFFPGVSQTLVVAASYTSNTIAGFVPKNAKRISGYIGASVTTSGNTVTLNIASDALGTNQKQMSYGGGPTGLSTPYENLELLTAQTYYYQMTAGGGTFTAACPFAVSSYEF
ncbi:conserved hypothetical protein [Paraburkholderia piptadeniae]|uniref:Tail fiber protein n=1 Tax=Paraburkholderia piptadeniae TaxID=1701573 RepID=A0A1N7S8G9_9BURK|nr:hypothetical protein [Paraburkholderia piptadeniae]SIT43653.1 conserved hypothetical protein [Paraburkholderia piptadeniae]